MENASKAILIAGAILITLVVTSIIIIFFNRSADTAREIGNTYKESDIQNHNAQFNIFEGTGRTKGDIDRLVAAVNRNNRRVGNNEFLVTLEGIEIGGNNVAGYTFIGGNTTNTGTIIIYSISLIYDGNGIITRINIT